MRGMVNPGFPKGKQNFNFAFRMGQMLRLCSGFWGNAGFPCEFLLSLLGIGKCSALSNITFGYAQALGETSVFPGESESFVKNKFASQTYFHFQEGALGPRSCFRRTYNLGFPL